MTLERKWKYLNLIIIPLFHIVSLYSLGLLFFGGQNTFLTILWAIFYAIISGLGVTAGVHRLWSHRSYKAKPAFRFFLALCFSAAGQNTIPQWVLDHRVHHKHSDTEADPHNVSKGFLFSHVGWLCMTKHRRVIEEGKKIPIDDVLSDPIVKWHTKNFKILKLLFCFVLPVIVPVYFWNETWTYSIASQIVRYALVLNFTWSVNSFAHIFGNKPFNKNIRPSENKWVALFSLGEGWHNYHHVFPYDYKTGELGSLFNVTKSFLDFSKRRGWIYETREAGQVLIDRVIEKNF